MNLPSALFISAAISAGVWTLVILQPSSVQATGSVQPAIAEPVVKQVAAQSEVQDKHIKTQNSATQNKVKPNTVALPTRQLVAVSNTIALANISSVWQQFSQNQQLHSKLVNASPKVYVQYTDFYNNFANATVAIGYDKNDLSTANIAATTSVSMPKGQYTPLLPMANYSVQAIAKSWDKIDFSRPVTRVVEVHQLDTQGNTMATANFVFYGE